MILNCDKNIINGLSYKFAKALRNIKTSIVASPNIEEYGINFIGSKFKVLEILEPLILEEDTHVLKPFFDMKEKVFTIVDKWNHTQIYGMLNLSSSHNLK